MVGPNALGLVDDVHQVEALAEVGVALLLFGIGLELSLNKMRRLWKLIVFGGAIQVGLTIAVVAGLAKGFGEPTGRAIFLGCVIAVSSTAIVLTGLRQRGVLEAPQGRVSLGILVFQDLFVVPALLVIPLLAGNGEGDGSLALALFKAIAVVVGVVVAARLIVPRWLDVVARTRQRDLFILTVFLICIGTAWAVSFAGISLALGAFLGGLVVAGSGYRHQALSDLIPFRDVLTSIFFVSVGMLLDMSTVVSNLAPITFLLGVIVIGKFVIVLVTGAVLRLPFTVAILAAAALAQVGEFSFILFSAAQGTELLVEPLTSNLLTAIILSMLITPLAIQMGPHIAAGAGMLRGLGRRVGVRTPDDLPGAGAGAGVKDHVIIAGFGVTGQELANSLNDCGIAYVILDINSDNVRQAIQQVQPAYYGDVTSMEVLERMGVRRAKQLVIVINDPGATARAIKAARSLAPDLHITVRAPYVVDVNGLVQAGATDVVISELEASAEVTARVLRDCGVGADAVDPQLERIRQRTEDEAPAS